MKITETIGREIELTRRYAASYIYFQYALRRNITVGKAFKHMAKKYANKICMFFENEQWTYKQVDELANQIGNFFLAQGFKKGDKIALFMENCVEYICIWLGLSRIGVITALINTNLQHSVLLHCLEVGKCQAIIYGQEMTPALKEIQNDTLLRYFKFFMYSKNKLNMTTENRIEKSVSLNLNLKSYPITSPVLPPGVNIKISDELFYIYTSGTTGLPKAAIVRHWRYIYLGVGAKNLAAIKQSDRFYISLPLYHTSANIVGTCHALVTGGSIVIARKFSASRFWDDCHKYQATGILYIGEICRYLLATPPNPLQDKNHKVRFMLGNGLRGDIWTEFLTRFNVKHVAEFYASTEGNCSLANQVGVVGGVGYIPKLVGRVIRAYLIRIDENGEPIRDSRTGFCVECKVDEPGELIGMIKPGDPIRDFSGYTDQKSKERKIVHNVWRNGDLAFRSGDILVKDKDGIFFFRDRQGDTYRWKGENVSTNEVESIISRICGLQDAAVYGVLIPGTDGRAGMAAIVDPANSLDLKALASKLATEVPSYARPVFIRKLQKMDMTGTFKLKKVNLQEEAFDIRKISDPVFMYCNGSYVPLTHEIYEDVMQRKIRV